MDSNGNKLLVKTEMQRAPSLQIPEVRFSIDSSSHSNKKTGRGGCRFMYIHCASQRLSLGTTLKICSIIIICKLNNLSEHAFKLDPPLSSKN